MKWDDRTFEGKHAIWWWFVSRSQIDTLCELVVREHRGYRLWITSFDSGPITPSAEELSDGWKTVDGAMVSPPLEVGLDIPNDQYDEWYIFDDDSPRNQDFERFINYGGFNLADPRATTATFDSTWERDGLDWLYPMQERFWRQMEKLSPVSYIGSGDNDVIVTRQESFANFVRKAMS